ncbi:MAG: hypothetical protein JWQ10_3040 [Herbaspirillum sp.]|nr:hypothetical protein [Herbaspirillum sp.]
MEENEVMTIESGTIALLNESEIEQQVAIAHKFPRAMSEGPGARFVEVIASAWGNSLTVYQASRSC